MSDIENINYDLPTVVLDRVEGITEAERNMIQSCLHRPINGTGKIKATRPKVGVAESYLWRALMVYASPEEKFHTVSSKEFEGLTPEEKQWIDSLVVKVLVTMRRADLPGIKSWETAFWGEPNT